MNVTLYTPEICHHTPSNPYLSGLSVSISYPCTSQLLLCCLIPAVSCMQCADTLQTLFPGTHRQPSSLPSVLSGLQQTHNHYHSHVCWACGQSRCAQLVQQGPAQAGSAAAAAAGGGAAAGRTAATAAAGGGKQDKAACPRDAL